MTLVILFVFGLIIGSFLNVLALRYNSGVNIGGRSKCPSCGKVLKPLELIPVLSFIFMGGRCRGCKARISSQYPLVELFTALVFVTVFNAALPFYVNALLLSVFSLYIAILIYDLKHQIIPDGMAYLSTALAFLYRLYMGGDRLDYLAGIILAAIFALIWLISKGRAMGLGDAKLVLSLGLLLGGAAGFSGIILSFWIGATAGLILLVLPRTNPLWGRSKRITIKSAIPFAPFLIVGGWLALIFKLDLLHVSIF